MNNHPRDNILGSLKSVLAFIYFLVNCFPGLGGFLPIHPMTYIEATRNRNKMLEEAERLKDAESESSPSS